MPPTTPLSICGRCLRALSQTKRGRRHLSYTPNPTTPPRSAVAKLTNRRVLSLQGIDAPKFLQGLVTSSINTEAASTTGCYAAFLTAQGKVLNDVFLYPTLSSAWHTRNYKDNEPGYLVDIDGTQAARLLKHLKRHQLRAKLKIKLLDENELDVWSVWKEDEPWIRHTKITEQRETCEQDDMRAPGMGRRVLLSPKEDIRNLTGCADIADGSLAHYTIRRYLKGVPEGQDEIPREESLPMNYNIDLMGGIDFKKGCYVGQELTIRTHHTGVVRRRVLPVMLSDTAAETTNAEPAYDPSTNISLDETETDIKNEALRKRTTGKLIAHIGNVGLAICRVEQMTDLNVSAEGGSYKAGDKFIIERPSSSDVCIKPFVPDWMRSQIRAPRVQRRIE